MKYIFFIIFKSVLVVSFWVFFLVCTLALTPSLSSPTAGEDDEKINVRHDILLLLYDQLLQIFHGDSISLLLLLSPHSSQTFHSIVRLNTLTLYQFIAHLISANDGQLNPALKSVGILDMLDCSAILLHFTNQTTSAHTRIFYNVFHYGHHFLLARTGSAPYSCAGIYRNTLTGSIRKPQS